MWQLCAVAVYQEEEVRFLPKQPVQGDVCCMR